jgi:hypothetical protein
MMNHTPGPWRYEPSIPEEGVNCWWIERVGRPARTIASVDGPQGSHTEPDARLIAAAPDLLDALQRIAQYPVTRADELSIEGAREIARAALARALPANSLIP